MRISINLGDDVYNYLKERSELYGCPLSSYISVILSQAVTNSIIERKVGNLLDTIKNTNI